MIFALLGIAEGIIFGDVLEDYEGPVHKVLVNALKAVKSSYLVRRSGWKYWNYSLTRDLVQAVGIDTNEGESPLVAGGHDRGLDKARAEATIQCID